MGTRADFYVGLGESAEWLGSIGWDGYPDGDARSLLPLADGRAFRQGVTNLLRREDGTTPEMGWPWPWEDSRTTDYAYSFDGEKVVVHNFGRFAQVLADGTQLDDDDDTPEVRDASGAVAFPSWRDQPKASFPDMSARKNVTYGKRSGVTFFGGQP